MGQIWKRAHNLGSQSRSYTCKGARSPNVGSALSPGTWKSRRAIIQSLKEKASRLSAVVLAKWFFFKLSFRGRLLCGKMSAALGDSEGFPGSPVLKNPPADEGDPRDTGSIPESGRSPEGGNGNPLQYSCLENPMDRGAWQVNRVTKNQTWLSNLTTTTRVIQKLKSSKSAWRIPGGASTQPPAQF